MIRIYFLCLSVFFTILLQAQPGVQRVPKFWLRDTHGLHDAGKFNGYSKISFMKEIEILTQKNVLGKYNTVYMVYKTQEVDSISLLTLLRIPQRWQIFTNQIITPTEKKINRGNLSKGIVLNFSFADPDRGVSNDYLLLNNNYDRDKTAIYEVLVYDGHLSDFARKRIDTYLALKYGISLFDSNRYLDLHQNDLWSNGDGANFGNEIMGVGRSDAFGWYQLTTVHSEHPNLKLTIQADSLEHLNSRDKRIIRDESYLLVGNNGKSLTFNEAEDGVEFLQRAWKVQSKNVAVPTTITLEISDLQAIDQKHWLYINRTQPGFDAIQSEKYLGVVQDSTHLVFSDIIWDKDGSGGDYFTIGRKAKFNFDTTVRPLCFDLNTAAIKITGGTAPYKVVARSPHQEDVVNIFDNTEGEITALKNGVYQFEIQDALGEVAVNKMTITKDALVGISMDEDWFLGAKENKVLLKPKVINAQGITLNYQWFNNGKMLSRAKQLEVNSVGKYQLIITDNQGCERSFDAEVFKDKKQVASHEKWTVFPNPAKVGEAFDVKFDLAGLAEVVLYTYAYDGKFINKRQLGEIKDETISHTIYQPGVYLLVAIIQGKTELKKVVVQ